jgi:hypothetical protein
VKGDGASNAKYAEAEVALQTDSTSQPPTLNEAFQLPTLHSVVKYLSNTCCLTRKAGLFLGSLLVTNKKASKQTNKQQTNKQTNMCKKKSSNYDLFTLFTPMNANESIFTK